MPPPPTPCNTRATISMGMLMAMPQSKDAAVNDQNGEHQQALAPDAPRNPAGSGQHDGIRDQIAGQHPGRFVGGGGEVAGDMRQGDVGHRRIEHDHEGRQHHETAIIHGFTEGRHSLCAVWVLCGLLLGIDSV